MYACLCIHVCTHVYVYAPVYVCVPMHVCVDACAYLCLVITLRQIGKVSHWMAPLPEDCLGEEMAYLQITWPVAKQTNRINYFGWDLEVSSPGLSPKEEVKMES